MDYVVYDQTPEEKESIKDKVERKVRNGVVNTTAWAVRNKEMLLTFGPLAIGAFTAATKVVTKLANLHKEEKIKNSYCYDRKLGHYWRLRRELTNTEWLEIDRRMKNGERLADILNELKVLK